jgi:hypothetical protein
MTINDRPTVGSSRLIGRYLAAGVVLAALGAAAPASAQKTASITFKGTLLNSLGGACATSTYNTKCPSGSCFCQKYFVDPDTKADKATGPLIGKATSGEIDITLDGGSDFVGTGGFGNCRPFFASLFVSGGTDDEQLDVTGATCSPLSTKSSADPILGGYGIESSSSGHQGFGKVTGTIDENTGAINLKFSGPAT